MSAPDNNLLVQVASYNTNLQGNNGLPQDLVDWLSPTLKVSSFLSQATRPADIIAVGFQELLPLQFGFCGLSRQVIESRDELIRSQLEQHAPNKERYTLVAKVVNVGIALLLYVRDEEIAPRVCDVQTQWTGCGPCWMGNKGAVGIRFRLRDDRKDGGETFTFVNAHLNAFEGKLARRIADYKQIVSTLLFPPTGPRNAWTSLYSSSHLFFVGDLNFRLAIPPTHPYSGKSGRPALIESLRSDLEREKLKEFDELLTERRSGNVFVGLREGEFWQFKCTYKYMLKEVDKYKDTRIPAWTDRVMYSTYTDSPESPEKSEIKPIIYTSIPSYVTSDHKPIVALLAVPTQIFSTSASQSDYSIPTLKLPDSFTLPTDPNWYLKRACGTTVGYVVGFVWTLLWYIGLGNAAIGAVNFLVGAAAWTWWTESRGIALGDGNV